MDREKKGPRVKLDSCAMSFGIQVPYKRYQKPATPCERLLAHASVSDAAKEALRAELAPLDPAELLHQIREGQAALAALGSGDLSHGPERQSLDRFSTVIRRFSS